MYDEELKRFTFYIFIGIWLLYIASLFKWFPDDLRINFDTAAYATIYLSVGSLIIRGIVRLIQRIFRWYYKRKSVVRDERSTSSENLQVIGKRYKLKEGGIYKPSGVSRKGFRYAWMRSILFPAEWEPEEVAVRTGFSGSETLDFEYKETGRDRLITPAHYAVHLICTQCQSEDFRKVVYKDYSYYFWGASTFILVISIIGLFIRLIFYSSIDFRMIDVYMFGGAAILFYIFRYRLSEWRREDEYYCAECKTFHAVEDLEKGDRLAYMRSVDA